MSSKRIAAAALCLVLAMMAGCDLSVISRRGSVQQAERERLEATGTAAAWLAASTLGAQQLGGWDLPTNEDDEPEMPGGDDIDALGGSGTGEDVGTGDNSQDGEAFPSPELPSVEVQNEITGSGRGDRRGLGLRRLLGR